MYFWIFGTEMGLVVLLWISLGKFPGFSLCGMLRSIFQLQSFSRAFTWVGGKKFWEKRRGLGAFVSSREKKGLGENPCPPSGPKLVVGANSAHSTP